MAGKTSIWICTVCGALHTGDEPSECCVVCGAGRDRFEFYQEPAPNTPEKISQWRCLVCDYVAEGSEPPAVCPICGAPAEQFEALRPGSKTTLSSGKARKTFVIVGAGIAGISAAEAIRKTTDDAEIVILSKEDNWPYYRLNLTRYLAGEIGAERLPLHPDSWYEERDIQLRRSTELCSVHVGHKRLTLRDGEEMAYDKLVLAMGAHPFVPAVPGIHRENVRVLRSQRDTEEILAQAGPRTRVVVIGGGLLGLEAAGALVDRVASVAVLEGYGWLLPRQLTQTAAGVLEQYVRSLGIQVYLQSQIQEIVGDERARGVLLADDERIPADLIVVSTGVRPNSYIARLAGLEVHHGIVVNNHLQTSAPDIYAAGDVAEHQGVVYGIWGPSLLQGRVAGRHAAGDEAEFKGIPRSNMLKVLGFDMFSIGRITPEDASFTVIEGTIDDHYRSFIFRDQHLVGAVLLGDTRLSAQVKKVIEQQRDCAQLLQDCCNVSSISEFLSSL